MSRLRHFLDRLRPNFTKGGRYEKFEALYEMVDTFIYTPPDVTRTAPHVRDGIDLKRVMTYVVIALVPCLLVALYNTGYQANLEMVRQGYGHVGHDPFQVESPSRHEAQIIAVTIDEGIHHLVEGFELLVAPAFGKIRTHTIRDMS